MRFSTVIMEKITSHYGKKSKKLRKILRSYRAIYKSPKLIAKQ